MKAPTDPADSGDTPPDDENALFRQAVGEVRPVGNGRVAAAAPRPKPLPQQTRADEVRVVADLLSDPIDPVEIQPGDMLSHARPGVQHAVLRKLRRGQYRIEAELDLHGHTAEEARHELVAFLDRSTRAGLRCVRIIHGKGLRSANTGPVLKTRVAHWLGQRAEVLAYCSARPVDGGTGALYVLLRGRR